MASDNAMLHQNSQVATVAFMALGMSQMKELSMISMEVIEMVSVCRATLAAPPDAMPMRLPPQNVKPYPNINANTIAKAVCPRLGHCRLAPMADPNTSPIPQPIRQCRVWLIAWRVRASIRNIPA